MRAIAPGNSQINYEFSISARYTNEVRSELAIGKIADCNQRLFSFALT